MLKPIPCKTFCKTLLRYRKLPEFAVTQQNNAPLIQ